jgi:RNA polymerase sigma-70 factor (ECF subfamily)
LWAENQPKSSKSTSPQIVKTIPTAGETAVDSKLPEITVVFDRDMGEGMSWTGGPPLFPPLDKDRQSKWVDARTCILPVKLERGSFYRLGVNSSSYQNFRGRDGVPADSASIYFATAGATAETKARAQTPAIVSLEPANGAQDVDSSVTELKVTFNCPMSAGMTWTGKPSLAPMVAPGKAAGWSVDSLTCTLPVKLEPGRAYELELNDINHTNFQTKWGVPLKPVAYRFHTRAAK